MYQSEAPHQHDLTEIRPWINNDTHYFMWNLITYPWPKLNGGMMTSSNADIFRVTGHLCGEFTGPRWIPRTKASDAELWCFLWSASE